MSLSDGLAFARSLRERKLITTGWSAIPAPQNAAAMAQGGLPAVCVDLQHGQHTEVSTIDALSAVHQAGGSPGLRIPVGRFDLASRAVDAGAQFVIAPMINNPQDAAALVEATKYPPVGGRSWGPARALDLWAANKDAYLASANELIITFAMIETVEAVDNLDAILAVPGIDAVFVGPSDLSITLSKGAALEPTSEHVLEASADIARRALDAGKVAGVYAFDAEKASAFFGNGFSFAAVGSDIISLKAAAAVAASATDGA